MTSFLTPSRTPTAGATSALCVMNKGLPTGWYAEAPIVTVTQLGSSRFTASISLGNWNRRDCVCVIDCAESADVTITAPAAGAGDPTHSNWVKTPATKICPANEVFDFSARVNSPSASVPMDFLLEFTDVFGNVVKHTVSILRWLSVKKPSVSLTSVSDPGTESESGVKPDYHYAAVTIPFQSEDSTDIESSVQAYQVERYLGHAGNRELIRGWVKPNQPSNPNDTVRDYLLLDAKTYGYRVRYRSAAGDESPWSDWEILNT
jgi:hypothetical protein